MRTINFSADPQLEEKPLEVLGLYMRPPGNAIVLCMDEKTGIQALDRTQPFLDPRSKKPKAWSNEDFRHGTLMMLAAVDIETAKVLTWVNKTRKTDDFFCFMDLVVRDYPGRRLCVVMDNLNTLNGRPAQALVENNHPPVTIHYTPRTPPGSTSRNASSASSPGKVPSNRSTAPRVSLKSISKHSTRNTTKRPGRSSGARDAEKLRRVIELTKKFRNQMSN